MLPSIGMRPNWMKQGDYYYYMSTLPANGETSRLLLNSVTLKGLKQVTRSTKARFFRIVVRPCSAVHPYKDACGG